MNSKMRPLWLFCIVAGLLSACNINTENLWANKCIASPSLIGQTWSEWHDQSYLYYPKIAPLLPWQFVVDIPFSEEESPDYIAAGEGIRTFVIRYGKELWMLNNQDGNTILRYDLEKQEWKTYNNIDDVKFVPATLYVARDNTLWGIGLAPWDERIQPDLPLLSRYNPETDRFEFVKDKDQLLNSSWFLGRVKEDIHGNLWMVLHNYHQADSLFAFDVNTEKATLHLTAPQVSSLYGLAIAQDNSIWVSDSSDGKILRYDFVTGNLKPFNEINEHENLKGPGILTLFFDHSGKLWVEDRGWIDFNTTGDAIWNPIKRSDSFVSLNKNNANEYLWDRAGAIYETSDGSLWFSSIAGMIQANIEKEEWCRFTTGQSPIVEDKNQNLWIVVFGRLYKYALKP